MCPVLANFLTLNLYLKLTEHGAKKQNKKRT